jgi:hypothetical protein
VKGPDPTQRGPDPIPEVRFAYVEVLDLTRRPGPYIQGPALSHGGPNSLLIPWSTSLSAFRPRGGGSLDRRVNCRCVSQPRWVGARWDTKGENSKGKPQPSCCPAPRADGCTCSRGLQAFAWERERALCVGPFSRATNLPYESPGPSFYRRKERA